MRGQGVDADAVRRRCGAGWGQNAPILALGKRPKVEPDAACLRRTHFLLLRPPRARSQVCGIALR